MSTLSDSTIRMSHPYIRYFASFHSLLVPSIIADILWLDLCCQFVKSSEFDVFVRHIGNYSIPCEMFCDNICQKQRGWVATWNQLSKHNFTMDYQSVVLSILFLAKLLSAQVNIWQVATNLHESRKIEVLRIAVIGAFNVGKTSLLNALIDCSGSNSTSDCQFGDTCNLEQCLNVLRNHT